MSASAIAEAVVAPDEYVDSLESLLQRRLSGRVRDLHVVVRDKGLVLQGRAATYYSKQVAQHAAMELAGLPILANDIEVA